MNEWDLEEELKQLSYAEPSAELDQRVHAVLRFSPLPRKRTESASFSFPATAAAACLLIGTLTGYALAALSGDPQNGYDSAVAASGGRALSPAIPVAASPADSILLAAHLNDTRYGMCQRCHRAANAADSRMELLRHLARYNAELWEKETGEEFLLASHVTDSRFDACRQCHVPDSAVEAM